MSKIISSIVALMLGAALISAAVAAPGNKGFYYGAQNPNHLAELIEATLKKDSSGKTLFDATKCHHGDGSCGSPLTILTALQQVNPGRHLKNVSEVPGYLRTKLKEVAPDGGTYRVSCLRPLGGDKFEVVMDCLERAFEPGEKAWVDVDTEIAVFASKCANVILRPIPLKITIIGGEQSCAEIHFFARAGETIVRHAPLGMPAFEDDCFAIKKVGEKEFHIPWSDACKSDYCTFAASESFLKKKAWKLASYELEPGEYVVRVPIRFAEKNSVYVMVFCIERTKMSWPEFPPEKYTLAQRNEYAKQRNEWIAGHSDSVNVWPNAYHVGSDGIPRAFIYPSEREVPASEPIKMYWRWGVWVAEHPQQYR